MAEMNQKRIFRYIPLIPIAAILASVLFSPSCANTTEAPKGGPKDTIPPVITRIVPPPGTVDLPVKGTQIAFTFNEYVCPAYSVMGVRNCAMAFPVSWDAVGYCMVYSSLDEAS